MLRTTPYYTRFESLRGNLFGLPQWGRVIVAMAAIPGIVLLLLSMLAFAVSLLALLLLTVPVYAVLKRFSGGGFPFPDQRDMVPASGGARRVEATVVEPTIE